MIIYFIEKMVSFLSLINDYRGLNFTQFFSFFIEYLSSDRNMFQIGTLIGLSKTRKKNSKTKLRQPK